MSVDGMAWDFRDVRDGMWLSRLDRDTAMTGLVHEAAGWAGSVNQADAESLLAWAREYLPRIVALAAVEMAPRYDPS